VISRYNAIECFEIAFTCEQRDGFHVHDDLCYTRTAGPGGQTLPPGQRSEVIISNLVNRATVLLNYRLGDFASVRGEPCPCGRTTTLLSSIDGRVSSTSPTPPSWIRTRYGTRSRIDPRLSATSLIHAGTIAQPASDHDR
jgi:phenylacetate-coenzyme A ligase PaaK-like adenylate-forming protein